MKGTFYCRSELRAPWALELPPRKDCISFHVVLVGRCHLHIPNPEAQTSSCELQPGELALIPHGDRHMLSSQPGLPPVSIQDLPHHHFGERYAVLSHGGDGEGSTVICGSVRFDHPVARRLVEMLPALIHVRANEFGASHDASDDWLRSLLSLMAIEATSLRPGGEAVITRLTDVLIIQAIRAWIERDPTAQKGWLGALRDPKIGKSLSLIHREPARDWTLEALAHAASMSRSAFAAHFRSVVGEPAMQYVTRWRMMTAATWLKEEHNVGLGDIASRLGYQSEAAFSRAFKRFLGESPGALRRREAKSLRQSDTAAS
ncbi:MAG: AraC family transcriptional regulator [Deltaproteobacteria bacterium]|nr:AraC family transcriptional regulator [Deltaproteobacteria bacterium]